jgi:hypothetical protein
MVGLIGEEKEVDFAHVPVRVKRGWVFHDVYIPVGSMCPDAAFCR